ncbi:cytochrome d ubiquinol oxidase subunit II [Salinispora arenicola]|uniref:cytochrome d ubiquinol oxidase subunit II n=1 Tax=Salinispora arenicola TaxID=168697 RepID=UPI00039ADFD7|nr:cytochrome d ubiquinol oxidase subunit II [Salinispora arenicola]
MDLFFVLVLGLLFGGYLVLDGFDIGSGMLVRPLGRTEWERRVMITAFGPFFLANEVWLVATGGVLFGAFPLLEREVLGEMRPLVWPLLVVWLVRDVAVWSRSRSPGVRWRGWWDTILAVASTVFAAGWGVLIANLLVQFGGGADLPVYGWFSLLWAVTMVAVFAGHGAVFLTTRLPQVLAAAVAVTARRMLPAGAGLLVVATVVTVVAGVLPQRAGALVPAALVGLVAAAAPLAARVLLGKGRSGGALALTAGAVVAPLLVVAATGSGSVRAAAADTASLSALGGVTAAVLPVVLIGQVWMWWVFRHRVDDRSVVFF